MNRKILVIPLIVLLAVTPVLARKNYGYRFNGDVNHDCIVNDEDLSMLNGHYPSERGDKGYRGWADTNKDGRIDDLDMAIVNDNYGKNCWGIPDLNLDGVVDMLDLNIIIEAFGTQPGMEDWDSRADLVEPFGLIDGRDVAYIMDYM